MITFHVTSDVACWIHPIIYHVFHVRRVCYWSSQQELDMLKNKDDDALNLNDNRFRKQNKAGVFKELSRRKRSVFDNITVKHYNDVVSSQQVNSFYTDMYRGLNLLPVLFTSWPTCLCIPP